MPCTFTFTTTGRPHFESSWSFSSRASYHMRQFSIGCRRYPRCHADDTTSTTMWHSPLHFCTLVPNRLACAHGWPECRHTARRMAATCVCTHCGCHMHHRYTPWNDVLLQTECHLFRPGALLVVIGVHSNPMRNFPSRNHHSNACWKISINTASTNIAPMTAT